MVLNVKGQLGGVVVQAQLVVNFWNVRMPKRTDQKIVCLMECATILVLTVLPPPKVPTWQSFVALLEARSTARCSYKKFECC